MGTLVCGLNEERCHDFVGSESWAKHAIQWRAPETLATDAKGHQVIWLYRAPWAMIEDGPDTSAVGTGEALTRWLEENRSALNMRRQLGASLLLVNADSVPAAALRARLDGTEQAPDSSLANVISATTTHVQLLGQLFERTAPQYWDVLEALEAAAWLPSGEPLFRGTATASEKQLFSLLDALRSNPRLNAEVAQLRKTADEYAVGHDKLRQEKQELKQEGDLLLLQLHQVQEELEQYYLKNIELDKAATNSKALQVQLRQMQDELKRLQTLHAPPASASASAPASGITHVPTAPVNGAALKPGVLLRFVPTPARRALERSRSKKILMGHIKDVRASEWFDEQWYLDQYPDVRTAKIDAVEHYFMHGRKENRNPGAGFDTAYYLRSNPDVANSVINPLWHFIRFGRKEGRLPRKP